MANDTRIDFYESLVSDLVSRYKEFYLNLKDMFGKRPYGFVKMNNLQKLAWLEQITQDDPRIMDLYSQVGFDRLMSLLQEKASLEAKYQAPTTGPESISSPITTQQDSEFLRRYIESTMFPRNLPVSQLEQFRQLLAEMQNTTGYRQQRAAEAIASLQKQIG